MDYITYLRSMVGKNKVLMPVCGALIFDDQKRILLQHRADTHSWGIPGGFMELDENVEETARRETYEETGIELGKLDFYGIYSGKDFHKTFPNGDQAALVQILFTCRDFKGKANSIDEETLDARFFPLDQLPAPMLEKHQRFINDYIEYPSGPVIG
ncbi:NUDIX hydrolase [Halobacillus salinarum]|uniref:NUDIX hydrolase n=1 Tax=Halobacillus salinarum TaxID=2932257 RepID=A0ABY4EL11_9BACI|nr:NUDIX hydrolase [Halobacillus salinarum]UOQ45159.1 NUDIX hydrolase [Halobacillus salinarum]